MSQEEWIKNSASINIVVWLNIIINLFLFNKFFTFINQKKKKECKEYNNNRTETKFKKK
jgi:hypothetical protein